ncbi:hypothetical protein SynPROS91_01945 [Synechococcus sp. PROS-9-1]|nr:hypothetical protein SynPROS91_01945 [Synechococcus sp. PROS-9-1]
MLEQAEFLPKGRSEVRAMEFHEADRSENALDTSASDHSSSLNFA